MRSFRYANVIIHHYDSCSGLAEVIVTKDEEVERRIELPCAALLAFAASVVERNRISAIEQSTYADLLGLPQSMIPIEIKAGG